MKKALTVFSILTIVWILGACDILQQDVTLPDLEGKTEEEIVLLFDDKGLDVQFMPRHDIVKDQSSQFIEYGQFMNEGDQVERGTTVTVIVSAPFDEDVEFFEPVDMDYDGPRLDEEAYDNPYYIYDEDDDIYIGGGGAFSVNYQDGYWSDNTGGCIDGDTTVFTYPTEVYNRIESNTPSVRYLNLDTPETWPPGEEEEWGQPATQYVCEVLADAESVVLQTDPGDNLLGRYGRLLAWVWVQMPGEDDYELLNYNIVRQGLGVVAYEYGAGTTEYTMYDDVYYNKWMHKAEERAMDEQRGMHSDDLRDYYWDYDNEAPHPIRWP